EHNVDDPYSTQTRNDLKSYYSFPYNDKASRTASNDYSSLHKSNDFTKQNSVTLHNKQNTTPERLIHLYKEEKKKKLNMYTYMTYEIITYFQLKKTFLLDMSEHINFAYYAIGHIIKVNDLSRLINILTVIKNEEKNKKNSTISNNVDDPILNEKKNRTKQIFFIINIIKCERYVCTDRYTNIKFEIVPFEKVTDLKIFKRLKNNMIKNKKITIDELDKKKNLVTYICDLNNILDDKLTVDEYNI
ncbi:conserved protein, unknown function, partial [Hepatocystis sp. ex Piliocolobus tephrosceles]